MFDKDLGIDLGTSNTIIYMKDSGIVLREPSIAAVDVKTNCVIAVGNDAKNMFGRTPGSLVAVKPLKDGVISDLDITAVMLKKFMNKIIKPGVFNRIKAVICVPQKATEVEKRALTEAATKAGLAEVVLLEAPLAAAIGSGVDISLPNGHMVVDIGAGTCEAAVTSLGDIVTSISSNIAGNKIDEYIISYLKHKYKLVIGEGTAEKIKINIGSAYNLEKENFMQVKGRSLFEGLPKSATITSQEVREAIEAPLNNIVEVILNTVEKTPPELVSDIIENGLVLTGGSALLHGLDYFISKTVGVKANVAPSPFESAAIGTGKFIEFNSPGKKQNAENQVSPQAVASQQI